jgi:long-subunit fatty acid transport protein
MAGDQSRIGEVPQLIYQSGFNQIGAESWAAGGTDIIDSENSAAALSNPALLQYDHLLVHAEFSRHLQTTDAREFIWDSRFSLPDYAAISFPLKPATFTLGYANTYSLNISLLNNPIQTVEQPEGTGEFYDVHWKLGIHSFFLAGSFPLSPNLAMGSTIAINYLHRKESVYKTTFSGNGWGSQIVVGFIYHPGEKLSLASAFSYKQKIQYEIKEDNPSLFQIDPDPYSGGNNDSIFISDQRVWQAEGLIPWEFKMGISYNFSRKFIIMAMLNVTGWSETQLNYENSLMAHLGVRWNVSENTTISMGYFNQKEGDNSDFLSSLNQNFLTAGLAFSVMKNLRFSAALLDSHLLTGDQVNTVNGLQGEQFNQTQIMAGLSVRFN